MRRRRRSSAAASALDELELERDPDAARALAVLTESRLLTVDEGAVEVAHEALLREWPRLRGWLEADAEGRRLHHHLIGAAREWRDSERDSRRALPRRPARRGARLGRRARPRAERARARLPRREPGGERARGRAPAPRQPPAADAARRGRGAARRRGRRRGDRDLRAPGRAQRGHRRRRPAPRRPGPHRGSPRPGASPRQHGRRPRRLGRDPLQPALGARCATPRRSASLNGDGSKLWSLALSPDGRTLAVGRQQRHRDPLRHPDAGANRRVRGGGRRLPGSASIPGTARSRSSRRTPAERGRTCRSSTRPPSGCAGRSRSAAIPAIPGSTLHPRCELRPGRTERDRRLLRAKTGAACSCAGSTSAAARRWGGPYASAGTGFSHLQMTPDGRVIYAGDATYAIDAETLRVVRRYPVGGCTSGISPDGATLALGARERKRSPARPRLRAGADP